MTSGTLSDSQLGHYTAQCLHQQGTALQNMLTQDDIPYSCITHLFEIVMLHTVALQNMVLYSIALSAVAMLHNMVRHTMTFHNMVFHSMPLFRTVLHCMTLHSMTLYILLYYTHSIDSTLEPTNIIYYMQVKNTQLIVFMNTINSYN